MTKAARITQSIKIGEFTIWKTPTGAIWITHESGEGGEFSEQDLADAIGKFYAEKF